MKPMLARTMGPKFAHFPIYVQPKLNGIRAVYQAGNFQSRGEKLWKPTFYRHIVEELAKLNLNPNIILDGEFYVHGWRLQRIASATGVNNNEPNTDTPNIQYHIFDVANLTANFSDRFFDIYHTILNAGFTYTHAVPTGYAATRGELEQHFRHYTALGYEGIMGRCDLPYELGTHLSPRTGDYTEKRSHTLWKYKSWNDGEYLCVGTTPGEGKASIGIGALVFAKPSSTETFKVGTGFSDEDRVAFYLNPPIGRHCKIRYLELTADGTPFNPSFLCLM